MTTIVPQEKIDKAINNIKDIETLPLLYALVHRMSLYPVYGPVRAELKVLIHKLEIQDFT